MAGAVCGGPVTRRIGWTLVVLGLLGSCAPVTTGMLRGTLAVPRSSRPDEAVVWLDELPESATSTRRSAAGAPPSRAVLVAKNQRFEPRFIALAAGDTLVFRNEDRVYHGAFSVSPQSKFELGKLAPGQADKLTFTRSGPVQVRCDIHPEESATVYVLPNRAFTRPNAAGEWRLAALPEGSYVVHAWAPGLRELRREATVTRRGEAVVQLKW
jgi:plastocyanin